MIPLPRWAWPFLLDKKCPNCGTETSRDQVESVGIKQKKQSAKIIKGNAVLIFSYYCSKCQKKSDWEADPDDSNASAEDISLSILEAIEAHMGRRQGRSRNKVSSSQISNKEFQAFRKKLAKFKTHEDFLIFIGIPQEQIDKYKRDEKDGDKTK